MVHEIDDIMVNVGELRMTPIRLDDRQTSRRLRVGVGGWYVNVFKLDSLGDEYTIGAVKKRRPGTKSV